MKYHLTLVGLGGVQWCPNRNAGALTVFIFFRRLYNQSPASVGAFGVRGWRQEGIVGASMDAACSLPGILTFGSF